MTEKAYQICFSWDRDVLKIVIAGTLLRADANDIAESVGEIFDRHKPAKVLIDCTGLDGRLSVVDTFFHVREHKISLHRPFKVAVLDRPENKDYYSFHETAAANVGLHPRFFGNHEEAVRWLQDEQKRTPHQSLRA